MFDARARVVVCSGAAIAGPLRLAARVLGFARPAVSAAMDWLKERVDQ